jgi:hypothetical protein
MAEVNLPIEYNTTMCRPAVLKAPVYRAAQLLDGQAELY